MPRRVATFAVGAKPGSYGGCLPSTGAFQNRYKAQPWRPPATPVPSAQIKPGIGMSAISASELQQRLSEQLQALSQVGETLTLRLLELEERLEGLEEQVLELDSRDQAPNAGHAETGELLAATEERIARLEELLTGRGRVEPLPLRRPLAMQQEGSPTGEPPLGLNPFPEDEEQPFMDELSA
jgi:hypothetical protein